MNSFVPPSGYTEAQVVETIDRVVNMLAHGFTFGYMDLEDVKQYGRLKAITVLTEKKYDPSRKLDNFLYSHVKNQYINLKRDKYKRTDPPCHLCHGNIYVSGFRYSGHEDGQICDRYAAWQERNSCKQNLVNTLDLASISDESEIKTQSLPDNENIIATKEILDKIDKAIPLELRQVYLQMKDGYKAPKIKREQVNNFILQYAQENNLL